MSTLSPTNRLRSKTSDLTDFFRGSGHSANPSARPSNQLHISTTTLPVPDSNEVAPSPKKKTSRIPFLGRQRKKSQPTAVPPLSAPVTQGGFTLEAHLDRAGEEHYDVPSTTSVSTSTTVVQNSSSGLANLSTTSLGSKIAAHFHPSRSRKLSLRKSLPPPPDNVIPPPPQDTLSPPSSSPRTASFESGSSGATSRNRSPTPRSQPSVAFSVTQESLTEYADLFTLPKKSGVSSEHRPAPPTLPPKSESRKALSSSSSDVRRNGSSKTSSGTPSPDGSSTPTSRSVTPSVVVQLDKTIRAKPVADRTKETDRTLPDTRQLKLPSKLQSLSPGNPTSKSLKRLSAPIPSPTQPPTIPLPPPPTVTSRPSTANGASSVPLRRPRANTVGTAPSLDSTPSPSTPSQSDTFPTTEQPSSATTIPPAAPEAISTSPIITEATSPSAVILPRATTDKENGLNINTAGPEQLKQALTARNKQYDELASYLLKVTAAHLSEKSALEKKIASLEREGARKDKEIKGLTWLLLNNRGYSGSGTSTGGNANAGGSTVSRPASVLDSDSQSAQGIPQRCPSSASSKLSPRRLQYQYTDESGAESHPTSGAESLRGSGASSSESPIMFRTRRLRKTNENTSGARPYGSSAVPSTITNGTGSLSRSSSVKRISSTRSSLATDLSIPDTYQSSKRSSVSSYITTNSISTSASAATSASSPASSVSSLPMASPSPANANSQGSSLSAIPEAPTPSKSKPSGIPTSSSKEDRRNSRIAAPRDTYASNLRKGRPPSIAQVLERTPTMDDVFEKLKPFAGSS
ncbi:hypothetical protein BDN72DRAFT_892174 [Pluteus cervinus]|uniref:Uncharacterized protein n=1 Tax=Pluteus cervinus TaxID=181527 RepID=A0ACD3BCB6_9AGAR|nr:hypothetical protein BDN72DRAFT_892174 [Pluteus cervinus]